MTPEEADIIYRLVEAKRKIQKARYTLPDFLFKSTYWWVNVTHLIVRLGEIEQEIDEALSFIEFGKIEEKTK